jgi:uncharacterized cupin superfamily protein
VGRQVSGEPNVFAGDFDFELPTGVSICSFGKRAGMDLLGATVYELQPGARWADLHVHYANEELILVLAGAQTLHSLEESRELQPGELVACPRGPKGAHRLENASGEPARVLIVSTMVMPEVVEYPEDGRVFVMTEPPYTDAPFEPDKGRILRVFKRDDAHPIPPDA